MMMAITVGTTTAVIIIITVDKLYLSSAVVDISSICGEERYMHGHRKVRACVILVSKKAGRKPGE